MSSYISNYKLMKNERVLRKKKRIRVWFWKKKKRNFYKGELMPIW